MLWAGYSLHHLEVDGMVRYRKTRVVGGVYLPSSMF